MVWLPTSSRVTGLNAHCCHHTVRNSTTRWLFCRRLAQGEDGAQLGANTRDKQPSPSKASCLWSVGESSWREAMQFLRKHKEFVSLVSHTLTQIQRSGFRSSPACFWWVRSSRRTIQCSKKPQVLKTESTRQHVLPERWFIMFSVNILIYLMIHIKGAKKASTREPLLLLLCTLAQLQLGITSNGIRYHCLQLARAAI